ncbi:MAG: hypothetical protein HGA80_09120 [Candidatus Omnitrophica bacterium]|nr:hypothetical protein [Candidatus Omnitrophota bacterium]
MNISASRDTASVKTAVKSADMTFAELLRAVRQVKCEESRTQNDGYCEVVVATAGLAEVTDLLRRYFGEPFKPQGKKPSGEASAYAAPYGGVYDGQTLYVRQDGSAAELALLWPWGSGLSVTIKLARTLSAL